MPENHHPEWEEVEEFLAEVKAGSPAAEFDPAEIRKLLYRLYWRMQGAILALILGLDIVLLLSLNGFWPALVSRNLGFMVLGVAIFGLADFCGVLLTTLVLYRTRLVSGSFYFGQGLGLALAVLVLYLVPFVTVASLPYFALSLGVMLILRYTVIGLVINR